MEIVATRQIAKNIVEGLMSPGAGGIVRLGAGIRTIFWMRGKVYGWRTMPSLSISSGHRNHKSQFREIDHVINRECAVRCAVRSCPVYNLPLATKYYWSASEFWSISGVIVRWLLMHRKTTLAEIRGRIRCLWDRGALLIQTNPYGNTAIFLNVKVFAPRGDRCL